MAGLLILKRNCTLAVSRAAPGHRKG